jgi:putative CocE/NonD family hydrolase
VDVEAVADRSKEGVRNFVRCGGAAPVTPAPWPPKLPHVLQAPQYRLGFRVVCGPTCRVVGQPVFPWRQGTPYGDGSARVKFSLPERLHLAPDFCTLRLRWFDRWLRRVDNGVETEPAVRVFVMEGGSGRRNAAGRLEHGGHWRQAATWPLPDTQFTPYYLHTDGALSPATPAAAAPPRMYRHDPTHPVPTIGGPISSGEPLMVGGAFDQRETPAFFGARPPYRPLAERPDILVFQTAPLTQAVEVTGPIVVHLWITSDCPDTDVTAKLIDVYPPNADYPNGYAMNLTGGILRVRYRDAWESATLMQPGQVYAIRIALFPCSNWFAPGHRLRLDIASSNFPHFDLNFNTGDPEGLSTHSRVATNTVYMDQARPSHVLLPLIPTAERR